MANTKWLTTLPDLARWSLWAGNCSFLSYSKATLNLQLIIVLLLLALFVLGSRWIRKPEAWAVGVCLLFFLAMIYQGGATAAFTHTLAKHAEPWYLQGIYPCIWGLAFLGGQRNAMKGRILTLSAVLCGAWIALNTFNTKLILFYGGYRGRSTLPLVLDWWRFDPKLILGSVALVSVPILYLLTITHSVLLLAAVSEFLRKSHLPPRTKHVKNTCPTIHANGKIRVN